jgi:hypothetical protein
MPPNCEELAKITCLEDHTATSLFQNAKGQKDGEEQRNRLK